MVKLILADDEKNKRVGKGLTRVPHPLEVGRVGEPVSAVHPPGRLSAGKLQPWPHLDFQLVFLTCLFILAASRMRPFALRRLITFFPPRVFMRARKPCVRTLRRFFG